MARGYVSFLQLSTRVTYCSGERYTSHAAAQLWVKAAVKHYSIQGSDAQVAKYPLDHQPDRATIWSGP